MESIINIIRRVQCRALSSTKSKRDSISILAAILRTLTKSGPSKKMSMVYGSNINYERLGKYLDLMVTTGLVELTSSEDTLYGITKKGREFLGGYDRLAEALNISGANKGVAL